MKFKWKLYRLTSHVIFTGNPRGTERLHDNGKLTVPMTASWPEAHILSQIFCRERG